jgi:dimethylargininase
MRALTRGIPASFTRALSARPAPIDVDIARNQHAAYCAALEACGAAVTRLAPDEEYPDCVFVEDTAVIAEGIAIITRPGALSRRGETTGIEAALRDTGLTVTHITEPGTLDGGDCMRLGNRIYVGRSARTNAEGIAQLAAALAGVAGVLEIVAIDLPSHVLHLKCVCSPLSPETMLLADESLPASLFDAHIVRVPAAETYAANAVAIGKHVIVADGFPRTLDAIITAGFTPHLVPTSEVRKADGSLTCQSLLYPSR